MSPSQCKSQVTHQHHVGCDGPVHSLFDFLVVIFQTLHFPFLEEFIVIIVLLLPFHYLFISVIEKIGCINIYSYSGSMIKIIANSEILCFYSIRFMFSSREKIQHTVVSNSSSVLKLHFDLMKVLRAIK